MSPNLTISALYTYPIKSCGAITHQAIGLNERGLLYDRQWMLVYADGREKHQFVTQRELHRMALIQPNIGRESMQLTAPNMPIIEVSLAHGDGERYTVGVWNDTCEAVDEGDAVAEWVSQFLQVNLRLVRMADTFIRLTSTNYTNKPSPFGFADGYPLLLIGEASLDDLNQRLQARGKQTLAMSRFRPNVVVTTDAPFIEDTWREIHLGEVLFDVVKPCARCAITTVDQVTGTIPDVQEPTATLATFRRSPDGKVLFGQNIIHRGFGTLHVGDTVVVDN